MEHTNDWPRRTPTIEPRRRAGVWAVLDHTSLRAVRGQIVDAVVAAVPASSMAVAGGPPSLVLAAASERVAMVFTELASNALRHAQGPVSAVLHRGQRAWLLSVFDTLPSRAPVPRPTGTDKPGGLGLSMVTLLSDRVGWDTSETGKRVWAEILDVPSTALLNRLQPSTVRRA